MVPLLPLLLPLLLSLLLLLLLPLLLLLLLYCEQRVRLLIGKTLLLHKLLAPLFVLLPLLLLLGLGLTASLLCQQLLQLCHVLFHKPAQTMARDSTCCSNRPAAATAWCRQLVCNTL
jgi:hypothetical protein